jgi:hypothetical protein
MFCTNASSSSPLTALKLVSHARRSMPRYTSGSTSASHVTTPSMVTTVASLKTLQL